MRYGRRRLSVPFAPALGALWLALFSHLGRGGYLPEVDALGHGRLAQRRLYTQRMPRASTHTAHTQHTHSTQILRKFETLK